MESLLDNSVFPFSTDNVSRAIAAIYMNSGNLHDAGLDDLTMHHLKNLTPFTTVPG